MMLLPHSRVLRNFIASFLLITGVAVSPAQAILVELEPDMYRIGTDVSNLFEGVTLNTFHNFNPGGSHSTFLSTTPLYGPVTVGGEYELAATGTRMFGYFSDGLTAAQVWSGNDSCVNCDSFGALLVLFDEPTNFFEIAAEYDSRDRADDWPAYVAAFGANREQVLGPVSSTTLWGQPSDIYNPVFAENIQLGSLDRDPYIYSVIIGGWENGVMLDRIRFNRVAGVPEPSTLLLLGSGLAGLVLWRRKQAA